MKKTGILFSLLAITLVWASPLLSHDFWLIPNAFRVEPGEEIVIHGQTSSDFPTSLSAVTVDRVESARILTRHDEQAIHGLDIDGNSLHVMHHAGGAGQAIVAVAILPRTIPESPESFRRYLSLEGAPEALARYEREGILPTDSITRRYAKYAKTVVEVGEGGPRAYQRTAGHPLEFVPLSDPSETPAGDSLRFRVLFLGEPLAHARGHASVAESGESPSAFHESDFETDEGGEFSLHIQGQGIWNVRALHITPAPAQSGADWDVHWATFVWGN